MAGSKSDYFENALLDYVFRGVSLGLGGSLYTFRTARRAQTMASARGDIGSSVADRRGGGVTAAVRRER